MRALPIRSTERARAVRLQILENILSDIEQVADVVEQELDVGGGAISQHSAQTATLP